jgi:hypothetical protein
MTSPSETLKGGLSPQRSRTQSSGFLEAEPSQTPARSSQEGDSQ